MDVGLRRAVLLLAGLADSVKAGESVSVSDAREVVAAASDAADRWVTAYGATLALGPLRAGSVDEVAAMSSYGEWMRRHGLPDAAGLDGAPVTKFDPRQPRAPKGAASGGQWVAGTAVSGGKGPMRGGGGGGGGPSTDFEAGESVESGLPAKTVSEFVDSDCAKLAHAIHTATGWPMRAITDDDAESGHIVVRRPDGMLVDVTGVHSEAKLLEVWPGDVIPMGADRLGSLGWPYEIFPPWDGGEGNTTRDYEREATLSAAASVLNAATKGGWSRQAVVDRFAAGPGGYEWA